MADVFRRGAKDVHRSIRDGGERFDVNPCNLDPGGAWSPAIPPGPRCPVCFRGRVQRGKRNKRLATSAGGAGVLALVAAVVGVQPDGDPVNALASPSFLVSTVPVTPGPSAVPPVPTATPAFTPASTMQVSPKPTDKTQDVIPQPTLVPEPTAVPTPRPSPTCTHPGNHYGVDACRWPGNYR